MLGNSKKKLTLLSIVTAVYLALFGYSADFCYFQDVIRQVSIEAHWYYLTNFESLLIHPRPGLDITPTGYHPPLISIITAGLWIFFGHELWVSHAFTFLWAILLIYYSWKLISFCIPEKWAGWATLVMLLESTVITQMVIASPDFILLTAFVIALNAIFRQKQLTLALALIFLCGINMRGIFVGVMLFFAHLYFDFHAINHKKYNAKKFLHLLLPYLPVLSLLMTYFIYYFANNNWFFADDDGTGHYALPDNAAMILKHLASLALRLAENGRFVVWITAAFLIVAIRKNTIKLEDTDKMLGIFLALITALYILFALISRMPFAPRYFMPLVFVLSLLVIRLAVNKWSDKKIKIAFAGLLFFTITGHLWIYPEKMAQSWESTLLHTPYYNLRKQCFDYIDINQLNYNDISAGFSIYGNRNYIELNNEDKTVGNNSLNAKYFIYSNISNLDDETIDELKNNSLWTPIKHFSKTPVFITIYKKNSGSNDHQ